MYKAINLRDKVNRRAELLNRDNYDGALVIDEISLDNPRLEPAELGLLRTVSWFYVLCFEAGKVGVKFLSERLAAYDLDPEGQKETHLDLVQKLRTYFQHNLTPHKERDSRTLRASEEWFESHCQTKVPAREDQWKQCLVGFLRETCIFLEALHECLLSIEEDDSKEQILKEWHYRRERHHPPHEFDRIIEEVAGDIGREALDVKQFRERFYTKWIKELGLLSVPYDFKLEARKRIEHALLHELTLTLPITGRDIIHEFNVSPGVLVGRFLERATELYSNNPCSRDELMKKLKEDNHIRNLLSGEGR